MWQCVNVPLNSAFIPIFTTIIENKLRIKMVFELFVD